MRKSKFESWLFGLAFLLRLSINSRETFVHVFWQNLIAKNFLKNRKNDLKSNIYPIMLKKRKKRKIDFTNPTFGWRRKVHIQDVRSRGKSQWEAWTSDTCPPLDLIFQPFLYSLQKLAKRKTQEVCFGMSSVKPLSIQFGLPVAKKSFGGLAPSSFRAFSLPKCDEIEFLLHFKELEFNWFVKGEFNWKVAEIIFKISSFFL